MLIDLRVMLFGRDEESNNFRGFESNNPNLIEAVRREIVKEQPLVSFRGNLEGRAEPMVEGEAERYLGTAEPEPPLISGGGEGLAAKVSATGARDRGEEAADLVGA